MDKNEDTIESEIEQIELDESLEIEDYSDSILLYRKKLRIRLLIIFISTLFIIFTRAFPKYSDFDVILQSDLFLAMFTLAIILSVACFLYVSNTKDFKPTYANNMLNKRILELFDLISIVPVFIAIITMSNAFLLSPATVDGASMEPSYFDLEDVIFEHVNLKPDYLDVVIFRVSDGSYWIKRVIGLPGDTVIIDHNEIFVNGIKIDQSFIQAEDGSMLSYTYCNNAHELVCEFQVPDKYYFVLGDNREHSTDSRSDLLGYVREDNIYGKVIFKYNNLIRNFLK
ncbi:MAG: signal peptidase I [Bacilli bacterium]|nr:signal peptidase I [Bacilli bacterium]